MIPWPENGRETSYLDFDSATMACESPYRPLYRSLPKSEISSIRPKTTCTNPFLASITPLIAPYIEAYLKCTKLQPKYYVAPLFFVNPRLPPYIEDLSKNARRLIYSHKYFGRPCCLLLKPSLYAPIEDPTKI